MRGKKTIYFMGDTHSVIDSEKLFSFAINRPFTRDDFIIQVGDFGFIWEKEESEMETMFLDKIENIGFSMLIITGNHDNIPAIRNNYPLVNYCGDKAYRIRPHIHVAPYGAYYTIHDKTIFCVGGAHCHDIEDGVYYPGDPMISQLYRENRNMYRVVGESWWPEEAPNDEERAKILKVAETHNWKADFIVSHQPPISTCAAAGLIWGKPDEYAVWLDENIKEKMKFKKFVSGHMHEDVCPIPNNYIIFKFILEGYNTDPYNFA